MTMNNLFLAKFNPDEVSWTRVILICLALLIIIIIIFGLIYLCIRKTMDMQGKKIDNLMSNVVVSGVINDKKLFVKVAKYKSKVYFMKKVWPSVLILAICAIIYLSYAIPTKDYLFLTKYTNEFFPKLVRQPDDEGFFGITWILTKWPEWDTTLVCWTNFPNALEGFRHYLILFWWILFLVGFCWYFWVCQSFVSRYMRIRKIAKKGFSKDLLDIMQQANKQTPVPLNLNSDIS